MTRAKADWRCPRCGRSFAAKNASHSCTSQAPGSLLRPYPEALPLYEAVRDHLLKLEGVTVEATKTQIAFRARRRFAFLWIPAMALKRGPPDLYLTFDLPRALTSPRIKEVVELPRHLFTHHMLLKRKRDLDAEAKRWLREAYDAAKEGSAKGPSCRPRAAKRGA